MVSLQKKSKKNSVLNKANKKRWGTAEMMRLSLTFKSFQKMNLVDQRYFIERALAAIQPARKEGEG